MSFSLLRWLIVSVWLLGFLAWSPVWADVPVPQLTTRITDLTGTLTPEQRRDLEQRLAGFEREKGSQIAVLIVPTTQPETIEQYGIRVADAWKLGRGGVDDGLIILMAKHDRTLRIEVGRGLEGVVPDAVANRIVEDIMVPYFRHGDFHGGLSAGIDSVTGLIQGEPLPKPSWHAPKRQDFDLGAVFFSFIGPLLFGQFLRLMIGRMVAGLITGGAVFLLISIILGLPLILGLILGFIAFVLVVGDFGRGGGGYGGRYRYPRRGGGWGGGGYVGGSGWSTGGGWSGGSDSGGFSGGGGGFSGGGASGQW